MNQVNKRLVEQFELEKFESEVVETPTAIDISSKQKRKLRSSTHVQAKKSKRRATINRNMDVDVEVSSDSYEKSDGNSDHDIGSYSEDEIIEMMASTRSGRIANKPTSFEAEFYPSKDQPNTKKSVSSSTFLVPPYTNTEFVDYHSIHCVKCRRSGSPHGPERVKLGPEEKRTRLLLCDTCSISMHNNCAPPKSSINKDTGKLKCQKCINSLDCTGCGNDLTQSEGNPTIPFRCHRCYRAHHSNCIAANVSSDLADKMKKTNLKDLYQSGMCLECTTFISKVAEKITSERTVKDQLEYLVKWKGISYRHTDWVSAKWIAHVYPVLYRSYIKRRENTGIPHFSKDWKIVDRILDVEWINKSAGQVRRILAVFKDTEYGEGKIKPLYSFYTK